MHFCNEYDGFFFSFLYFSYVLTYCIAESVVVLLCGQSVHLCLLFNGIIFASLSETFIARKHVCWVMFAYY